MEVPQGVGGLCEVLPAHQAPVLQRAAAAAPRTAGQRVREVPRDEGAPAAAPPLLHATPGRKQRPLLYTHTRQW